MKKIIIVLACFIAISLTQNTAMADSTENSICLPAIVPNLDLTQPFPRCGQTHRDDACILYIMNTSNYDRMAQDFFEEAAQKMGRNRYAVEVENVNHARLRIPPGYFVQIQIPRLTSPDQFLKDQQRQL